ncbi:MAG: flippase-like domain-containing protein [Candidatus Amulumruptor sp.]
MNEPDAKTLSDGKKFLSSNLSYKILIPVFIGLGVVAWLFHDEFSAEVWDSIHFDSHVIICIALAWLCMIGRDFGLSWRFRAITDRQLKWKQAIRVNMLCEFTSAVTPSSVGGSTFGMIYLHREGIPFGRATTLMMTTLILDESFFVIFCPILMWIISPEILFGFNSDAFTSGLRTVFWLVYAGIVLWTAFLFFGVIARPAVIKKVINAIFRIRILRRWQQKAVRMTDNMEATGKDLKHRSLGWWIKAFAATGLSWSSRYLVVNMLFLAFAPYASQLVVFGRQFVVWIVLTISPTPGGSGVSEWLFTEYYGDLLNDYGLAVVIALFWRIISYYIYLVIGACIVPGWIRQGMRMRGNKKTT